MKSRLLDDYFIEETFKVKSVKNYLPKDKEIGRKSALVAFWDADTGGLRTIRARDIIEISR